MRAKKYLHQLIMFFVLCVSLGVASITQAATHTQTVTIVKYGLSNGATGFQESQTINTGEEINHLPVYDNTGKELRLIPGITYVIQEIRAAGSEKIDPNVASTYQSVGAPSQILTDQNGQASLQLADGIYLVEEEANPSKGLLYPAKPLLIELPVWSEANHAYLDTLTLYPKSSVEAQPPSGGKTPQPQPNPKGEHEGGKNGTLNQLLPKTGGAAQIFWVLGGFLSLLFAVLLRRRKHQKN
ncbi:LPXTG cell wall anchor domain-containing protein [Lactococcus termiticola]|uniref:Gram-positive cocci surface proteins LPxTG domain-containing protein n=1 Tax=Lactococcus termiticola TaxID=2169526 RepID=A0A2R5HD06_9LACT|nr:LPXTG cell wall anchor domain-containing protein [Lactococcus termiticola]GBG95957.1 hypothetical protein NtB2_00059 [Lactococcus termiticola]